MSFRFQFAKTKWKLTLNGRAVRRLSSCTTTKESMMCSSCSKRFVLFDKSTVKDTSEGFSLSIEHRDQATCKYILRSTKPSTWKQGTSVRQCSRKKIPNNKKKLRYKTCLIFQSFYISKNASQFIIQVIISNIFLQLKLI